MEVYRHRESSSAKQAVLVGNPDTWDFRISTAGDNETAHSGCYGTSTAGTHGRAISGFEGHSTSGRGGYSKSGDFGHSYAGVGGTVSSGLEGQISIEGYRKDSTKILIKGRIGRRGLLPYVNYVLDTNLDFVRLDRNNEFEQVFFDKIWKKRRKF